MLDRLISGAGAVTDGADRFVRALVGGSDRGIASTRPGSLLVVAVLGLLAGMLVVAAQEATDPPIPVVLGPAEVATSRALGNRTYSTIHGAFSSTYVQYFSDDNANGLDDEGEETIVWYYWLVDRDARAGVTVRSTRPPEALFTFRGTGILIDDPSYPREVYEEYDDEASRAGLSIEPVVVLDTTTGLSGARTPISLDAPLPRTGTPVELTGARLASFVGVCTHDPDGDTVCDPDEQDMFEILVFDRASRNAIRVLVRDFPEFTEEATLTGLLRREERAVDDARVGAPHDFDTLDLDVSDRYVLDEQAAAGSAPLAFGLAAVFAALAMTILVGLAGGYLIYRRAERRVPLTATGLGPGERIPLRITGIIRTPTGLEHVREVPGDLIRFVLGRPEPTSPSPQAPARNVSPLATTLIVERSDRPQGVAVGLGELDRLSSGRAMTLRSPRPALRVVAGSGPLVLSFDTEEDRDRAASELLDESGLGPDGKHPRNP